MENNKTTNSWEKYGLLDGAEPKVETRFNGMAHYQETISNIKTMRRKYSEIDLTNATAPQTLSPRIK